MQAAVQDTCMARQPLGLPQWGPPLCCLTAACITRFWHPTNVGEVCCSAFICISLLQLRSLARCEHPAVHAVLLLVQACPGELMQKQIATAQCRYALTVWFRKGRGAGVQPEADEDLPQHGNGQPAGAQSAAADSTSSVQQETSHRAGAQSAAADAASCTPYTAPPIAEHQSSSSERLICLYSSLPRS